MVGSGTLCDESDPVGTTSSSTFMVGSRVRFEWNMQWNKICKDEVFRRITCSFGMYCAVLSACVIELFNQPDRNFIINVEYAMVYN